MPLILETSRQLASINELPFTNRYYQLKSPASHPHLQRPTHTHAHPNKQLFVCPKFSLYSVQQYNLFRKMLPVAPSR